MTRTIVGLDVSLTGTGLAKVWLRDTIEPSTWLTKVKAPAGVTKLPAAEKTHMLSDFARKIVELADGSELPALVVIEQPTAPRGHSAGGLFERGYVMYRVVEILTEFDVPVLFASPQTIKTYVTGKGNAAKGQVVDGIARRLPLFLTHGDEDLSDAAGAAAVGAALLGSPLAELPKLHTRALDGLVPPIGSFVEVIGSG